MFERVRDLLGGRSRRWPRLHVVGPFVLGLVVLALAAGVGRDLTGSQPIGTPIPSPYYRIVGHSGTHNISLLNLPVPYVGLPQIPIPVDVNGDLLPDITVSLNLINAPEGLLHNEPDLDDLLAQNLEINRLLTAPILGQASPPLRIEIVYTLFDSEGGPPTTIQAGYETGPGGSIPTYWKALLGGLSDFFNPLAIKLDTRPPLPNQYEQPTYRGPQSIVGAVDFGDDSFDFDLHYDPLPDDIHVTLATDDAGTHVTYNHSAPRDVDLDTTIAREAADGAKLDIHARIDRLPTQIEVDFDSNEGVGDLQYRSSNDGRAPDVGASIVSTPAPGSDDPPLVIDADIEALPPEMNAHWELPEDGPMSFDFDSPFSGIGAVQAEVRDYLGPDPAGFAFVPTEQQFASYHQAGDQTLVRTRVERVRAVSFEQVEDGVDATMQVGDGQLPLEVQIVHDDFDGEGTAMDANAVVTPLPSDLSFSMRTPDPGSIGEPLTISYGTGESGETADVDADIRIVEPGTTPTTCGTPGVICADLGIRHLPAHIEASVVNVTPLDTRVAIDMEPRPDSAEPDVFASVTMAQKPDPGDEPPDPIVAEVKIFGVPEHMRMRMANRLLDEDLPTERESFERAEFHACSWDFDLPTPGCTDAEGRIDAIDFTFRNFIGGDPAQPLLPETPLWVTVAGAGGLEPTDSVRLEAKGHITDIAEVQLLNNDDVFGLRTDVGGNQDLSATIDLDGLPIVFEEATDDDPAIYHRVDLEATATISPLPQHLDFCFQQKDRALIDPPSAPYTAACQNLDPFVAHDGPDGVDRTPLAIAYEGTDAADDPQEFDVETDVDLNERGDVDTAADVPDDDQHVRGHVDVFHLPGTFSAYVDSPPDDADGNPTEGPLRVLYDANDAIGTDQISVDFGLEVTDADFICRDPRQLPLGKKALCAAGVIDNLPSEVWLFYDPNLAADNFVIETSGSELIDITGLEASLVEGKLVDRHDPPTEEESDDVLETSVLVLSGQLIGLPQTVEGTLVLPGTVDLTATPPIGQVDLTVQNFIGPDPMPTAIPDQRAGVPGPVDVDQLFTIFQRDRLFRGTAHVTDLRGLAFATSRDAVNPQKLLDTNTIRIAFGTPDQTVRAYADLQYFAEHEANGDPVEETLTSVLGDVTIRDVPEEVTLCVRGKKTIAGEPAADDLTFCDRAPANEDEGAFSFVGDPGGSTALMDIHGFVRFAKGGGSDVLAARVDLVDIPLVVQGRFRTEGGTRVEFASFNDLDAQGFGITPQGIGSLDVDFADFDIATHGYDPMLTPPWGAVSAIGTVNPFPPAPAGQHLRLHLDAESMHVRGHVEDLQSVLFGEEPCEAPTDPAPDSYPYYPTTLGDEYTCISATFQNDAEERLDLALEIEKEGKLILLHDAGLTRLPDHFQVTIAKSEELDSITTALRSPCPDITPHPGNIDCMPPLIRVDTSGDATLFGIFETGTPEDLATIRDTQPRETLADLDEAPESWGTWGVIPDGQGNDVDTRNGVRLRVVRVGQETPDDDTDDRTAISAGIRIAIPESLTIDQIQTWSHKEVVDSAGRVDDAKDIRIRFVVREDAGGAPGGPDQVVPAIGVLAALVADDTGQQILASEDGNGNEGQGLTVPGEISLTIQIRHHQSEEEKDQGCEDDYHCHDLKFLQLEGRISAPISARVRILGGSAAERIQADILDLPDSVGVPEGEPSFMIRAEIDKKVPTEEGITDALLCLLICVKTDMKLESLTATLDFVPDNPNPGDLPRRIDAYIRLEGSANAIELRGYENIDDPSGLPTDNGTAGFDAKVNLLTNRATFYIRAGGGAVFFGLDLFMYAQLSVDIVVDDAEEFRINQRALHLQVAQERGGLDTTVDPNFHIYALAAASFAMAFLPIPLYVATFLPPSLPPPNTGGFGPALLAGYDCDGFGSTSLDPLHLDSTESVDVAAWIADPRYIRFGLAVVLVDYIVPRLIMCEGMAPEINLMDEAEGHPQPFFAVDNHPIGGFPDDFEPAPLPPTPPPPPPVLVVHAGPPLRLCGQPAFQSVVIEPGGSIEVATAADLNVIPVEDPDSPPQVRCPADQVGSLALDAGTSIDISGTITGPDDPAQRLIVAAGHVLVDDNGAGAADNGKVLGRRGKVVLQSTGVIDIEGDVRADEVITTTTLSTATGGGGAGHGGVGGNVGGIANTGGAAYGDGNLFDPPAPPDPAPNPPPDEPDPEADLVPTQPGSIGSTPGVGTPGTGGGIIYIRGAEVNVATTGTVSANGGKGSDNHATGERCSVNVTFDDDSVVFFANTGLRGSGGGSGGTIYINGSRVTIDGVVAARGGPGGEGIAGGGGGGSGGMVKIATAILTGTPDVTGGLGGSSACPANPPPSAFGPTAESVANATARPEFPGGAATSGATALFSLRLGPVSNVTPLPTFFVPAPASAPLAVPYRAAAPLGTGRTNEIVLCGIHRPPDSFFADDPEDLDPNDIDMAVGNVFTDVVDPCGTPDDADDPDTPSTVHELAVEDMAGEEAPADAHFDATMANGYWALYTRVLVSVSGDVNNRCSYHFDFFVGFFDGESYDRLHCSAEALPFEPDIAAGVDNDVPVACLDAPDASETSTVIVKIAASDNMPADTPTCPTPGGQPGAFQDFSGIAAIECGSGANIATVAWVPCGRGSQPVTLAGDGSNTVRVRVTDAAGNQGFAEDSTNVDALAPTSTAALDPPPPASGWYQTTPGVTISGFDDGPDGSGPPTEPGKPLYEWWVDGGDPNPCFTDPCSPPLNLTTGEHVFHWRAIDRVGNQENGEDPGNTLEINVDAEVPVIQLLPVPGAPDGTNGWYQRQPFAVISGLDQPGASGLEGPGAGVFFGLNDAAASTLYTGFITVPPGSHTVYFRAVDVAGNETAIGSHAFLVDDAAPVTVISNAAPNGTNGWHTSSTPVTLNVSDALPGSTVNPGTIPSGTFMSIDGAPLQPYTGPVTMGEGLHRILAYATDVSGQRSEIVQRNYQVDLSPPVSRQRVTPPLAARNNWWRTIPSTVLRATDGDQNAGVDSIVFRRNGVPAAFGTYSTPFDLDPGTTLLEWRAHDAAGRNEALRSASFKVDTAPPTATALNGPLLYIRSKLLHLILGIPLDAPLKWQVSDSLSGKVTVTIKIYNLIGQMVRTLEPGTFNVTPGVPLNGSTFWDGRDFTLTGLVPAGVYYYRVIATDDAGNVAQSGESKPITITIRLL